MKNTLLAIMLLLAPSLFSQEENSENDNDSKSEDVSFAIIENVPIYSGCDENSSNTALKACMSKKVIRLVSKNFNTDIGKTLNLPSGRVRILVHFKINKEGYVSNIKARASHPELEAEAIRIVKLIPKFTRPGIQRGRPVIVPYTLPIVFTVEEKPSIKLTKKELRALKKAKSREERASKNN